MLNKTVYITAAGVIVEKEGKLLLVQEGSTVLPEIYGKWNFPMGRMEKGEDPATCAFREGLEETGFLLKIESKIENHGKSRPYRQTEGYNVKIGIIDMFVYLFEASIINGQKRVPSDILDVQFFSTEEIEQLKKEGKLIDPYILSAIADYRELVARRIILEKYEELVKKSKGEKNF